MKWIFKLALLVLLILPLDAHATVASCTGRNDYTGNGSTTVFAYSCEVSDKTHLRVLLNGAVQTVDTHFTVAGVGQEAGGSITFTTAPTAGATVVILRQVPLTQGTSYLPNQLFNAPVVGADLDKQTMVNQQQQEEINRSLRFGQTQIPTSALTTVPTPVGEKCLGWNAAGTQLVNNDCAGSGVAGTSFPDITGGTNTAALVIGNGGTLSATGTGTITATAVPFSGVSAATNTAALVVGTGGSITPSGTGIIDATKFQGRAFASTAPSSLQVICWDAGNSTWEPCDDQTGGSPPFNLIAGGTNTSAAMVVGAGSSLTWTSTGTITASGVTGLTASRALQTSAGGALQVSSVTSTELGYLSGVTSAIQTQLAAREETANKNAASGYAGLDSGSRIAKAQGHSATAYTDQANTYTAGAKSTFSHSATTAGLNVGPVAGDPSALANGDVWYNSTTGKFRAREAGSSVDIVTAGGAVAFSAITGATNTNALVIGTGGSLTTSGSGSIAATTAAALASTPTLCAAGSRPRGVDTAGSAVDCVDDMPEPSGNGIVVRSAANTAVNRTITGTAGNITVTNGDGVSGNPTLELGATAVQTDQANTWTTGAQSMAAATSFTAPSAAGLATTANAQIGYDSTAHQYKVHVNSTARALPYRATTTPTSGNCVQWGADGIQTDAGNPCGTGAGTISGLTTGTIPKAASATSLVDSSIVEDADSVNFAKRVEVCVGGPCLFDLDTSIFATSLKTWGFPANASDTFVGAAAAQTLTNKTIDAEGTGNVITAPTKKWLPFAACQNVTASLIWDAPTSNPATAACYGTNVKGVADFDAAADESIHVWEPLPSDFTGAVDIKVLGFAAAITGTARLGVRFDCAASTEDHDLASSNTTTFNFTPDGTTNRLAVATATGITITGCAAGELAKIQFFRDADGTSGTDDMAGDFRGIGLEITYRRAM